MPFENLAAPLSYGPFRNALAQGWRRGVSREVCVPVCLSDYRAAFGQLLVWVRGGVPGPAACSALIPEHAHLVSRRA